MSEKITARMKWIVKKLEIPGAIIRHRRDWFWEKSLYALEWSENGHDYQAYVTTKMRQQLSKAGLIEIVEERPIYDGGKFRTTERDWGLPKRQPIIVLPHLAKGVSHEFEISILDT
jgi:hypothetical protein